MTHSRRGFRWMSLLVGLLVIAEPLSACGPYAIGAYFWTDREPGPERDLFLEGQLGILDHGLEPNYRYVAYRHLAALGHGPVIREALASLWVESKIGPAASADSLWRKARQLVPGLEPLGWLSRSRARTAGDDDSTYLSFFLNCLDDAFVTAAETLEARIQQFGKASPEVRIWARAQDQVFANCREGELIPEPLGETWDPLSRADRRYQIAAAYFYATRHQQAVELFRGIAADASSPWCDLAAYLVGRTLIRDGRYAEAEIELRKVLSEPRLAAVHQPARRLLAFASLRSDPEARRQELSARLSAAEPETPLRQALIDYIWLINLQGSRDEMGEWLDAASGRPEADDPTRSVALQHWRDAPSLPRLIAALISAPRGLVDIEDLLAAAAAVAVDSPAYLTASYHRSRLLVDQGRFDEARGELDRLLERAEELSIGDRNRLSHLRAEITPELDAYLRLAAVAPVGLGWDDGSDGLIPIGDPGSAFPYYRLGEPLLPESAVELLNHGLHTEEMLELVTGDVLPERWRRRLALATWTRAVVIGNVDLALATAPRVAVLAPELESEMAAYLAADAASRQFEAVWTMLRFPGLAPTLRWNVGRRTPISEEDSLRDNGWCADALAIDELPKQQVRSPAQIAAVQAALPADLPSWPHFVGRLTLARAESHPEDPRLPEALHRVVRATRIGCPMGGYADVSRSAFQALHRHFPSSQWAQKTPYWFD